MTNYLLSASPAEILDAAGRVYIRFTLPNKGHIYWRLDICQSITYEHVCNLYFPVKWVSILTLCSFTFQF